MEPNDQKTAPGAKPREIDMPPEMPTAEAAKADRFRITAERNALWFEGHAGPKGRFLVVSFDNLATMNEGWPREPWMYWRLAKLGYSVLGVQSFNKDWFRLGEAQELLADLVGEGFFDRFEKVLFVGASMGGFGALNYASVVPGATVLAFSPQTTMNREIAPFETRFKYRVNRTDWVAPKNLDAAKAVADLGPVFLVYDPHVPEDKAHATRLQANNVIQIKTPHTTHEAIRVIILCGAIFPLIEGIMEEGRVVPEFWRVFRQRRTVRKWCRGILENLSPYHHPKRSLAAALSIEGSKGMGAARQLRREAQKQLRGETDLLEAPEIVERPEYLDATRGQMAAMTMVGGDYFFLKRWVDYYGRQLGRENLYILSHGGDPEHRKIGEGCNVIYLPHDRSRHRFNQRRWQMLSLITTGLTQSYNWVLTTDVDEIVAVDPGVHDSLPGYLSRFRTDEMPQVVTPFAIEMVHNPVLERQPLDGEAPILSRRRLFRLNANYAKPCITRRRITFFPGGHYANHPKLFLDPHLYLFHLRFIDYGMTYERLATRRAQRKTQSGDLSETGRAVTGWDTAWDTYLELSKQMPRDKTVQFSEFRAEMIDGWRLKKGAFFAPGGARPPGIYMLPDRFRDVF